jgi:hypothetical protein
LRNKEGFIAFMAPLWLADEYYNEESYTYLQFCCKENWMAAAKFLLEHDADHSAISINV